MPVGFNRGPWFGKMVKPAEKALFFGTPSFTAGTKGVERGPVVVLKSDPFSIPGRNAKPEDVEKKQAAVEAAIAEVRANPAAFKGAWVLIPGESTGFARDGRKGTPEYSDAKLIPPLTAALVEAGARGTVQLSKTEPFRMLDGYVESWDKLPVLPDIKLAEGQYNEIKGLVEKGEPVELEFDIRNWFKMGPVKYHNVVATLRGTEFPDEYIVLGGHFDCFSSATGAVDDGSGFGPMMEAIRLIQAAGARPKRSIVVILFAAEEQGLIGSQAWLKNHPGIASKIMMMINRDGSPSAITGAVVPETWLADFKRSPRPWSRSIRNGRSSSRGACRGPTRQAPAGRTPPRSRWRPCRRFASRRKRTTRITTPGIRSTTSTASSCLTRRNSSSPRWSPPSSPTARPTSTGRSRRRAFIWPTVCTPISPSGPPRRPSIS